MTSEKDPNGISAHAPGSKMDYGKPRVGLMLEGFARALLEVAAVTTFGATKYSAGGWQYVKDGVDRYNDAKARHLLKGYITPVDEDTKLLHLAQEAWNALAVLELKLRKMENGGEIIREAETSEVPDCLHEEAERRGILENLPVDT